MTTRETYRDFDKEFRKRPTSYLIKNYKNFNAEYRAIARSELKKRKVPKSKLPYRYNKKKRSQSCLTFSLGF